MFWVWNAFYKRNINTSPGEVAKERFETELPNGDLIVINLSVARSCFNNRVELGIEKRIVFLNWRNAPRCYYRKHFYKLDFRKYFKRWRAFAAERKTAKRNAARALVDFFMPIIYSPWLNARGRPGLGFIRLRNKLENELQ